jgi:5-hydroxyisourate hydrolase-like protein (transthyretin family)
MRKGDGLMRTAIFFFLCAATMFGAMDGTVLNKTTGKPEAGVTVNLLKPGAQGMQSIGTTVSDAQGHFVFEHDQPGGGPQLLQAQFQHVDYNKLMTPNLPTSGVELDIYDVTKSPAGAQVAQNMLIFEPGASQLNMNQTVLVENASNTTYYDPELGGLRFYMPPGAMQVRVSVQGSQGMPLPRTPEKTDQPNVYKVDYAVKPGQSEFDISYTLPATSPLKYQGRLVGVKGMPQGPLRLIAPNGVTLAGSDIQSLGQEPKTQATIYNVIAKNDFSVAISGIGSLHGGNDATQVDTSDSPQVTEGKPPVYAHLSVLVALAFSILGVGLLLLFRTSPVK